jgi:hypothetical protein
MRLQDRSSRLIWAALGGLALAAGGLGCGGSASETPFPVEPVPEYARPASEKKRYIQEQNAEAEASSPASTASAASETPAAPPAAGSGSLPNF